MGSRALKEIRAVTFDAGGTLIAPWPSVGHVYAESATRHGLKGISPDKVNAAFKAEWKKLKNFHHAREEWSALVDRVFAGMTERLPSETFFDDLYARFGGAEVWRIFDDVLPALNMIASHGINLGIVSNWDERLKPLLEEMGLKKYFETVVVSCDVGFTKPSAVIFEHAAKKLGEAPENILHIGDDYLHDVEGAESAGFQALLVERGEVGTKEKTIRSLLELEGLIG